MTVTRYTIRFMPRAAVEAALKAHKKQINAGASLWDCIDPESLEKRQFVYDGADLQAAISDALSQDEYGEIVIIRSTADRENAPEWKWRDHAMAIVHDDTAPLLWDQGDT